MNSIWVSGANGLLGSALSKIGFRGFSKEELDITNYQKINQLLEQERPQIFINAAAQAKVDLAEVEKERSLAVNGYAVENLAKTCAKLSIRCIHISTDYVLDYPNHDTLYENLKPNPKSTYARSKYMGEAKALAHGAVVIRVQWMYGCGETGFFAKALQRLHRKEPLVLVRDQVGSPTPVDIVAKGIEHAFDGPTGLYHLACRGSVSAEDWISSAAQILGIRGKYSTTTRDSLSPIHRPARSCLGHEHFTRSFGFDPGHWKEAMKRTLEEAGCGWLEK